MTMSTDTTPRADGIAIIGMAGRFPGAQSLEQFWDNLANGVESISIFSDEELMAAGVDASVMKIPGFVNAGSILADVDMFDTAFFGFSPRDAETTDPQQRLFLECAWEGLEDAGYRPDTYPGLIGVYGGSDQSTYVYQIYADPQRLATLDSGMVGIGNDKDYLTTLTSYKMNLRGPSIAVQTACSTSLVDVCLACQTLSSYQCDIAIAGGVAVNVPQKKGYFYQPGGILSPDGHCRTFDASGQGTVVGNGVAIVVLKRLSEALADGDAIRAIIRGTALNNDGSMKVGFGAPSVEGQTQAIAMAQAMAGVHPDQISYIEAHGTATILGDPIEFGALDKVFRASTARKQFCAIGSLKSNVGHLSSAAGAAGLIKTVMALEHQAIPPSLHFATPNPHINFPDSAFYVNTQLSDWKRGERPRIAGVSSFGVGGTNAHVVVEEAPAIASEPSRKPAQLLILSARSAPALEAATDRLAARLETHPGLNLADVAYTLQVGRKSFTERRVLVCRDCDDARAALQARDPQRIRTASSEASERPLVFMFSGQGSQYVDMGRQLYEIEPIFRATIDKCHELLTPHVDFSLRDLLYPSGGDAADVAEKLRETSVAQPALFAIEYALAGLWLGHGVCPLGLIGHSIGEYVAACLAGVLPLEDAIQVVALRGKLMGEMPHGSMLAVPLCEADVQLYLSAAVSIAAVNAPSVTVLSGPSDAIGTISGHLAARGVQCRPLHTSHAFHSSMMDPAIEPFVAAMQKVKLSAPQIPYMSNLTGTWFTPEEATTPDYWGKHLRQTVRFGAAVQELLRVPNIVLLEVGPGQALTTLARMQAGTDGGMALLSSLRPPQQSVSDYDHFLDTLGQLWLNGVEPHWPSLHAGEQRMRQPLPTYPFERRRYWIGLPEQASTPELAASARDISQWFYAPSWKPVLTVAAGHLPANGRRWLVFADAGELSRRVIERLRASGNDVAAVFAADQFGIPEAGAYQMRPEERSDYEALVTALRSDGGIPTRILHLWNTVDDEETGSSLDRFERAQTYGFYSLAFLAQALAKLGVTTAVQLGVVTSGIQVVLGEETISPARATVLGAIKVIAQELTNLQCRNIDVVLSGLGEEGLDRLADQLIREMSQEGFEPVVAYRNVRRWLQTFEPVPLAKVTSVPALLKHGGVYVITGGLGSIGLTFARYLADTVKAKLALIGRTPLPPRSTWDDWLATSAGGDTSRKIRSILALEEAGAQVLTLSADSADRDAMRHALDETRRQFGAIDGVIHGAGNTSADGFFPLERVEIATGTRQFAPKAHGLMVLHELLQDDQPQFYLLLSSLSAVLGGLGLIAYAAANVFLDAYAAQQNAQGKTPWITVNWDAWQFHAPEGASARGQAGAILPADGIEALERILEHGPRQVIVSTADLQARLRKWIYLESLNEQPTAPKGQPTTLHPRPNLSSQYIAPVSEVEKTTAGIWQQVLGVSPIGLHDKFFELGGHSLLAVQLISQLREAFQVEIPAQRLFEAPTIAQLAASIEASLAARGPAETEQERLARMLELVESMSEEEVGALLADPEALAQVVNV
jgi:acyl transferase domain-containing protein/acyl carrier protein